MERAARRYAIGMSSRLGFAMLPLLCIFMATPAAAQEREAPYWASIRVSKINMRVGPARSYRITWVYQRERLPLKVLRLKEGWRLVEDPDGARGWVLGQFLSLDRTAIVTGKSLADIREKGEAASRLLWRVEPGVVGLLGDCKGGWCRFTTGPHAGFVEEARLWGPGEP